MVLAHLRSFVLPIMAIVVVPRALLSGEPLGAAPPAQVLAGAAAVVAGLMMLAWTVHLFVRVGRATLAPWEPTRALVVVGPYAHVRNPMISGVVCILGGEAALLN
jgi:protein-S-isoprenylcysteine O-methyltransferase Ste14